MPSAEIDNGFPAFDSEGTQGGGFIFEPPVVYEATNAGWPGRITMARGITVLKTGSSYRQVRVPTDDEIRAADIAYRGGTVNPIDSDERSDLIDAGYGDRISTIDDGTGIPLVTTGVGDDGFPYVNTDGATDGEEAELNIVDGFPVFTY